MPLHSIHLPTLDFFLSEIILVPLEKGVHVQHTELVHVENTVGIQIYVIERRKKTQIQFKSVKDFLFTKILMYSNSINQILSTCTIEYNTHMA